MVTVGSVVLPVAVAAAAPGMAIQVVTGGVLVTAEQAATLDY